jgi:hypothetical protein
MFPGGLTKMLYGQYEANKKEMKKNKAKSSCVCVCVCDTQNPHINLQLLTTFHRTHTTPHNSQPKNIKYNVIIPPLAPPSFGSSGASREAQATTTRSPPHPKLPPFPSSSAFPIPQFGGAPARSPRISSNSASGRRGLRAARLRLSCLLRQSVRPAGRLLCPRQLDPRRRGTARSSGVLAFVPACPDLVSKLSYSYFASSVSSTPRSGRISRICFS